MSPFRIIIIGFISQDYLWERGIQELCRRFTCPELILLVKVNSSTEGHTAIISCSSNRSVFSCTTRTP